MSDKESHHHGKNEIIIIKRHGGGHEGAHGGAWKIAYADFMTAMMAFFLIMWLVNAANEETKAAVASYFNPIKLTDSKPAQKGLQKPAKDAEGEATASKSKDKGEETSPGSSADSGKDKSATVGQEVKYSEADYFENPYAVLAEIAKDSNTQANISAKGEGGANDSGPATGADGGDAYRDPFDPDFWTQQIEVSSAASMDAQTGKPDGAGLPDDGTSQNTTGTEVGASGDQKEGDQKSGTALDGEMKSGEGFTDKNGMTDKSFNGETDKSQAEIPKGGKQGTNGQTDTAETGGQAGKAKGKDSQTGAAAKKGEKVLSAAQKAAEQERAAKAAKIAKVEMQARELEQQIRKEIGATAGKLAEGLTVIPTEGGLLVSISDQVQTPMFNVGSSVPRRETVLAMEKIGIVLKGNGGAIVIRGHTDGRQYKKGEYDNWRLSTARAQSAYFMLLQGGLPEGRVGEVSGFADRQLKIPGDPMNDQNRRIEILIKTDQG